MDTLLKTVAVMFDICLLQYSAAVQKSFAVVAPTSMLLHDHHNTAVITCFPLQHCIT